MPDARSMRPSVAPVLMVGSTMTPGHIVSVMRDMARRISGRKGEGAASSSWFAIEITTWSSPMAFLSVSTTYSGESPGCTRQLTLAAASCGSALRAWPPSSMVATHVVRSMEFQAGDILIREQLAGGNSLTAVCTVAAQLLDGLSEPLGQTWYENRGAVRDLVEQIMALSERSAGRPADSALIRRMLRLRLWSVWSLNCLGDSAAQSILIAEPLLADQGRELGPDHPDTLATCNNLADAYRDAGRTAEAITLFEQTVADRERVLGADHPETLFSRNNLAAAYRDAGRTAEAITLHEQTLADRERVL